MNNIILLINQDSQYILSENECRKIKPILIDFVQSSAVNHDKPVEIWLQDKLSSYMKDKTQDEIKSISDEILLTINVAEEKKKSIQKACDDGIDSDQWFAKEIKKVTSAMATQSVPHFLNSVDEALYVANESLNKTITTKSGNISQNPNLDGFIAEQIQVQTFNLNAIIRGSEYRARVLEPENGQYKKNSVDICVYDKNNKIVAKYQSKFYKDAQATEKAFTEGDYRGQTKLVPKGQGQYITKKCSEYIEAPDGTTSKPLSKEEAIKLRDDAQSENWKGLSWSDLNTRELALEIGYQSGVAALQGAAITIGYDIAQKLYNGEDIKGDEVVANAIETGVDCGLKAATAGALKVCSEKGFIKFIPKGTPAMIFANIAHVAIEGIKVFGKVAKGEIKVRDGLKRLEQTAVSTVAGMTTMVKGAALGAAVGTVFGPVGTAVGGFIGGTVGYIAGSKVGEKIVKGVQKVREVAVDLGKKAFEKIKDIGHKIKSGVRTIKEKVVELFS